MLIPKCIFAKCTWLACLLSFASLFHIFLVQNCLSQVKTVYLGSETVCPEKDRETAFYSPLVKHVNFSSNHRGFLVAEIHIFWSPCTMCTWFLDALASLRPILESCPSVLFIRPRYTWGPIYGSECLKLTDVLHDIQFIQVIQVIDSIQRRWPKWPILQLIQVTQPGGKICN